MLEMTYPKQVMKLSELKAMGFPEEWLMQIYRSRHQNIAWKQGGEHKKSSPILFDTEELEKYRRAQCTGI